MTTAGSGSAADEKAAALRTRLTRLSGPARTRALLELGSHLADRYWRERPGSASGLPFLNEAVDVVEEAHGYLSPGDTLWSQVGSQLGWLIGTRHMAHGGTDIDRDRGIDLLEESLPDTALPATLRNSGRIMVGQLLLGRATRGLQGDPSLLRRSAAVFLADADRAVECFNEVEATATNPALVDAARTLLKVAQAMRTFLASFGAGGSGFDFNALVQMTTALQSVQGEHAAHRGAIAQMLIYEGSGHRSGPGDRRKDQAAPPAAETLRAAFGDRIGEGEPLPALARLLGPPFRVPAVDVVDELVALAVTLDGEQDARPVDQLLLAAALFLRSRIDSGGWTVDDDGGDDRAAASTALLAAAEALPEAGTAAVVVALRLAALLDQKNPTEELSAKITATILDRLEG
ncbi:hypothetical protein JIG36_05715 [Actinoplanes sp. LDG1-06]|uniref:Uncharacterized protein n=1 Tax=Paractinoplanes ovalisporus TaxID=2810368 RepID=A0ABS2A5E2_9ACTN|nr:hypothetical protein [Actinoplanes ovalisporus]MBM2615056.1 hypothetical protein [Actinoplanes ovalisporus]